MYFFGEWDAHSQVLSTLAHVSETKGQPKCTLGIENFKNVLCGIYLGISVLGDLLCHHVHVSILLQAIPSPR